MSERNALLIELTSRHTSLPEQVVAELTPDALAEIAAATANELDRQAQTHQKRADDIRDQAATLRAAIPEKEVAR